MLERTHPGVGRWQAGPSRLRHPFHVMALIKRSLISVFEAKKYGAKAWIYPSLFILSGFNRINRDVDSEPGQTGRWAGRFRKPSATETPSARPDCPLLQLLSCVGRASVSDSISVAANNWRSEASAISPPTDATADFYQNSCDIIMQSMLEPAGAFKTGGLTCD